MKRALFLAAVVLLALPFARAQAPSTTAPLPSLLGSATKLFIGNAGDQENADCLRVYNDFYQGMSALGRFQLVGDPGQADLVLELHYEIALGQAVASHDTNSSVRQFRVVLIEPHTHVVVWSLTERTNYALFQSNRNKNLGETVGVLVKDLGSLLNVQPVPPDNRSKVPHPHL